MARRATGLRMTVSTHREGASGKFFVLTAYQGRTAIGHMELEPTKTPQGSLLRVAFAEVSKPGQGVGTKMYEHAAKFACKKRMPLGSDKLRTKYSEGFWKKQASKGRATCVVRSGGVALSTEFYEKGRRSCGHYALSCPAPRSLAGLRGGAGSSTTVRRVPDRRAMPYIVMVGDRELARFETYENAKSDADFINRQHARKGFTAQAHVVERAGGFNLKGTRRARRRSKR